MIDMKKWAEVAPWVRLDWALEEFRDPGAKLEETFNFVRQAALSIERDAEKRTARAYGGCKWCYGKGYGTQTLSVESFKDFGDEETGITKMPTEVPCPKCERGREFAKILERYAK